MITIYQLNYRANTDYVFFLSEEAAIESLGGRERSLRDWNIQKVKVFESKLDYQENNDQAVRKRAIAKLTEEEKKVLGISY